MNDIVSVGWLFRHLEDPDLIILDCRLNKPNDKNDKNALEGIFIPKTRRFDLNGQFSESETDLPHMMPTEANFGKSAKELDINKDSKIVVYDQFGIYSSPRVWWMFKAMGLGEIAVLDGGLPAWIKEGKPTTSSLSKSNGTGNFSAILNKKWVSNAQEVLQKSKDAAHLVLDARSAGRFKGVEPEPRAGLRGGHIPNSTNLPFQQVLEDDRYKNPEALRSIFEDMDVQKRSLTFSCGSGVTASIIALAAKLSGFEDLSVYDGSWSEWGQLDDYPVAQ